MPFGLKALLEPVFLSHPPLPVNLRVTLGPLTGESAGPVPAASHHHHKHRAVPPLGHARAILAQGVLRSLGTQGPPLRHFMLFDVVMVVILFIYTGAALGTQGPPLRSSPSVTLLRVALYFSRMLAAFGASFRQSSPAVGSSPPRGRLPKLPAQPRAGRRSYFLVGLSLAARVPEQVRFRQLCVQSDGREK